MISIIIPNYNKSNFIKDSLKTIIKQTYMNWEAIVVDDGSTDGSQQIIKKIAENEPRIQFYERNCEPKGGSVCRNIGLEKAKGDYLIFFDSDDLMSPNCLRERAEYMEKYTTLDFVVFPVGTFYKKIGDNKMVWRPKNGNKLKMFLRHDLPWHTMSPIWNADFVKNKLYGFNETFPRLQDVEFHTRALLQPEVKYRVISKTSPKCFYRIEQDRTKQSHVIALETMYQGIHKYISTFEQILISSLHRKYLRGTLVSFITQVNYCFTNELITASEYYNLLSEAESITAKSTVFSKSSITFLRLYSKLYCLGLHKIKGFNYISKRITQSL